jgi:hypothetical protein
MTSNERQFGWGKGLLGLAIVTALWCTGFLFKKDTADGFGAVAALFSGWAFLGVIYAIVLQKQELSLQRNELAMTREELKGQKEQLAAQNETLSKSNFDETFFQLLRLHHEITGSIELPSSGNVRPTGRDSFKSFYRYLRAELIAANGGEGRPSSIESVATAFLGFMAQH